MSPIKKGSRKTAPTTGIAFAGDVRNCFIAYSQILAANSGRTPIWISF